MKTLTPEDRLRIIEALIFSSSCEICADWTDEDCLAMHNLAKELNSEDKPEIKRIYLFGEGPYETSHTEEIPKEFSIDMRD